MLPRSLIFRETQQAYKSPSIDAPKGPRPWIDTTGQSFFLVHFTGQDLLPRGKGHNRTPRSLTRCPTSPTPQFTYKRQPQHRDHPTLIRIVRGFFNVPQNYQHSRNCETGPPVYRPYPRRLESLTNCRWNYKGSTLLLSYLKTLSVGPVGVSNS